MKSSGIFAILLLSPALVVPMAESFASAQMANASIRTNQQPSEQVLSLDDLIREALEKNLEAQSALHTINVLRMRVPQVKECERYVKCRC
jgi:hypothetical protein